MSAGDTARTTYTAARAEIIQRMQLRDYVLLVFLGFTSAIFGVALGVPDHIEVLLSIPFLTLGAAILISQHNFMAAVLGEFLSTELKDEFGSLGESAPQWDDSDTFKGYAFCAARFRFWGHIFIIFIPSFVALCATWRIAYYTLSTSLPDGHMLWTIWFLGFLCLIGAVVVIWLSHQWRMDIYNKRFKK